MATSHVGAGGNSPNKSLQRTFVNQAQPALRAERASLSNAAELRC
jgi:hypothetical protein